MKNSNPIAKQFFGEDLPDLQDLAQRTSLILVNSHFSINQARPAVPNFIEVAGLHIRETKALPEASSIVVENICCYGKNFSQVLEKVIQSSKNGVIYFSTGSMVLSETFDPEKLQAIFDVFKELPYQVLWKAKRDRFPDGLKIPKNIYFQEWMPQLDILCKFIFN